MNTVFIATCRNIDCIMHRSPALFYGPSEEAYVARAQAVGQHRIETGHTVDFGTREVPDESDAEVEASVDLDIETVLVEHRYDQVGCKCGEEPEAVPVGGYYRWWCSHISKVMS